MAFETNLPVGARWGSGRLTLTILFWNSCRRLQSLRFDLIVIASSIESKCSMVLATFLQQLSCTSSTIGLFLSGNNRIIVLTGLERPERKSSAASAITLVGEGSLRHFLIGDSLPDSLAGRLRYDDVG